MCYRKALPQEKEIAQQRMGILSETIPVILANDHTLASQDIGLLMFTPWSDEQVFLGQARQSAEACAALYTMHEADINSVEERCNSLVRLSVQRE